MANFQFEFFGLRLGKLFNYMLYFGSNNIEGVTESWVEAEMSWVEMDGAAWRWVHALARPVQKYTLSHVLIFVMTSRFW